MISKIIDFFLDIAIFVLLFLLAPLVFALMTVDGPVYAKVTGALFIMLIAGAVIYYVKRNRMKTIYK